MTLEILTAALLFGAVVSAATCLILGRERTLPLISSQLVFPLAGTYTATHDIWLAAGSSAAAILGHCIVMRIAKNLQKKKAQGSPAEGLA